MDGKRRALPVVLLMLVMPSAAPEPVAAVVGRQGSSTLDALAFVDPRLSAPPVFELLDEVRSLTAAAVTDGWRGFRRDAAGAAEWHALVDRRTGRVEIAEGGKVALVPGRGNDLTNADLARHLEGRQEVDLEVMERGKREQGSACASSSRSSPTSSPWSAPAPTKRFAGTCEL